MKTSRKISLHDTFPVVALVFLYLYSCVGVLVLENPSVVRAVSDSSSVVFIVQIFFLLPLFAYLCFLIFMGGISTLRSSTNVALITIFAWVLLSAFWSISPNFAVRRLVIFLMISVALQAAVYQLGARRFFNILAMLLAVTLLVDLFASLLLARGVHQFSDASGSLFGDWRGVHPHKNIAGAVAGAACVIFFDRIVGGKRGADFILLVVAFLVLWKTGAQTAIICTAVGVFSVLLYRFFFSSSVVLSAAISAVVLLAVTYVALNSAEISYEIDGGAFTGRGTLWASLLRYASDNIWLGSGYGSFWGTGDNSPIYRLTESWAAFTSHGHNGYLDVLVALGLPGALLAVTGYLVLPILSVGRLRSSGQGAVAFGCIMFFVVHNFSESSLLNVDMPGMFFLTAMAAAVRAPAKRRTSNELRSLDASFGLS